MPMTQVGISGTSTLLIGSDSGRYQLILRNIGSSTGYIGSLNVVPDANNASGGYPIYAGEIMYFHDYRGAVYGTCTTGSVIRIAVLRGVL